MVLSFKHMIRALAVVCLMPLLFSCATYNNRIGSYYDQVINNQYDKAYMAIDQNKLLRRKRNRLLYLFEKGKMAHLLKQYDSSNLYFNEADNFIEVTRTSTADIAWGTLLNPMMETYKGEDFEKFMVHYYKSLNYLGLGKTEDAMVEARRISLRNYAQQDKAGANTNRYSDDAFALMLQGIIYEQSGDMNNAFIAYRNAADVFLKHDGLWYGIGIPEQLKQDVLRTATANGFTDEAQRYSTLLKTTLQPAASAPGGELVIFWENGLAPVKQEQSFMFALTKDGLGNFVFTDASGSMNVPFIWDSNFDPANIKMEELRSLRVAFPRYQEQPVFYTQGTVTVNNAQYSFEKAENINDLAFATLKERFAKEMVKALSRLAIKKLAEAAARPKKDDKKKDEKEALASAIQLFNLVSEKADTRNWQSLPHTILYTRIPLQTGTNQIQINFTGPNQQTKPINLVVEGNGRLQVQNVCTLR
ncbi:hypothetical protein A4R26_18715 [Niastella populi]|uniref:Tetratricopeptide repeat protein n=2 Tax=Niastella populi TaxID=550983 RepID=A0A1V9FTI7_9BACT|nr:hypothetical protein A4R26_18715 [Niastella populi]